MPEEDTEIMTQYEDYSVEELRKALDTIMLYSELNDSDVAEMERILAVLRKKAPFPHPHTTEEMWAEFQADHAEELAALGIRRNRDTEEVIEKDPEECADAGAAFVVPIASAEKVQTVSAGAEPMHGKRSQKLMRTALIAAAVVVLMAVVTVAASAMGFNLWGWVPKWSDEDVRFVSEDTEKPYVEHIPDVLASMGITEPLYPTWLPDDFTRTESQVIEEPFFLHEKFEGNDRRLIITISPTSGSETAVYQKETDPPLEYLAGNTVHYIFDNTNEVSAVWNSENYTILIVGNISSEEMQRIIDSVYGVTK